MQKMIISRPASKAEEFDGIPNCYIGELDPNCIFSTGIATSGLAELIYESASKGSFASSVSIDKEQLAAAIKAACDQYADNIAPEEIADRFQDDLTEELGLAVGEAIKRFKGSGIAPFLRLKRVFVSEPFKTVCFDFECFGEEYLEENGFSFDLSGEEVEFVTPRDLLTIGSYPASRKK